MRSDPVDNKVYYYRMFDSSEHVLFDYNLQAGDTFMLECMTLGAPDTIRFVISAVDSIYINNVPHKRFWTQCPTGLLCASFAEGIGFLTANPFYYVDRTKYIFWHPWTQYSGLTCFKNKGTYPSVYPSIIVGYTIDPGGGIFNNNCHDTILTINQISKSERTIKISPQPAITYTKFHLPYTINEGSITITDIVGRSILQNKFNQKQELQIDNPGQSGIYFYRITDNENSQSFSGKIIFQ